MARWNLSNTICIKVTGTEFAKLFGHNGNHISVEYYNLTILLKKMLANRFLPINLVKKSWRFKSVLTVMLKAST